MPKDVFFALLSIWLLWKMFGSIRLINQKREVEEKEDDNDAIETNESSLRNK